MARRDEESADSGEDIPFDKKTKDAPEEDDDEDEEEEELVFQLVLYLLMYDPADPVTGLLSRR